MGFKKHGSGEVLREDNQKIASTWSEEDEKDLKKENDEVEE